MDSPQKKKSASLEDYIRDISETVARRCERSRSRVQEELDHVFQILEEDGIEEGSDLYFMALNLCNNALNRHAFNHLKTKQGRLRWIQFNWENK